jgi:hypothetical protein
MLAMNTGIQKSGGALPGRGLGGRLAHSDLPAVGELVPFKVRAQLLAGDLAGSGGLDGGATARGDQLPVPGGLSGDSSDAG